MAPNATADVKVHPFYRVWFTWVDPLITWMTVIATVLNPAMMIEAGIPPEVSAHNADHDFVIYQVAALFMFIGLITTVLLRYTSDLGVWRIVQASILAVDAAIIATFFATMSHQNRLDPASWRGMDWSNLVITSFVLVLRALFLFDVGVKSKTR